MLLWPRQVRAGDEHRAGQDILTKLRHRFLTCTGFHHHSSDFDHRTFLAEPLVIEPRFRDQFEVADLDEEYEALLEVGSRMWPVIRRALLKLFTGMHNHDDNQELSNLCW